MSTVAFIPYFGGTGHKAPSPADKRPDYLRRTVKSLHGFADDIWVGVCREEDEPVVPDGARSVLLYCKPHYLPYTLATMAQEEGFTEGHGCVYLTEADQVLHLDQRFFTPAGADYLVPHRLEQLGPGRAGALRGPVVAYEGAEYTMCERPAPPPCSPPSLYRARGPVDAYGGAFWCSGELFRALNFQFNDTFCVENITGFTAFHQGQSWKTTDWHTCFVEHLSGYDFHCTLPRG